MYNYEELLVNDAHGDPSVAVVRVRFRDEERVFEYRKGDFETETVLGEVASSLGSVPFELILHHRSSVFVAPVLNRRSGPPPADRTL